MPSSSDLLIQVFSPQRMQAYLPMTPHKDEKEIIELAKWDDLVCNHIWGEIRIMEVMLRNVIAKRLNSIDFKSISGSSSPYEWWKQSDLFDKKYEKTRLGSMLKKASYKLRKKKKGTEGHFIAELPMGFWCTCLSQTFFRLFWKDHLKETFPHLPIHKKPKQGSMKAEKQALRVVHGKIDGVRELLRNPIGHHHPMADKLPLIRRQLDNLYEIMDYIEPQVRKAYCQESKLRNIIDNPPFPIENSPVTTKE